MVPERWKDAGNIEIPPFVRLLQHRIWQGYTDLHKSADCYTKSYTNRRYTLVLCKIQAFIGSFWRTRKTNARTSRIPMERTPSEGLPVMLVTVATMNEPRIDALLPKIS